MRGSRWFTSTSPKCHDLTNVPVSMGGDPGQRLDALLINLFPVADSENKDFIFQHNIDHTVIADTILPKTCKLPFEDWIGVSVLRELFLDLTQDASHFCPG